MLRRSYTLLLAALLSTNVLAEEPPRDSKSGRDFAIHEFRGETTNAVQPCVYVSSDSENWGIEIGFRAQTDFPQHTWLKTTNRFGSKLRLWMTNGVEVLSTNGAVLAAFHLPMQITVSDILRGVRPGLRGTQWLFGQAQSQSPTAAFGLRSAFNLPLTNDLVLEITPLIYRADTNLTAQLVEFPLVKIKSVTNGEAQQITDREQQNQLSPK